ncbi:MAG TPA: MerR family transcriptional regulator [Dehalococcoidia bacterium]|nr:MerR family transcriptional regulator [Dehalococcoidia bacterium]
MARMVIGELARRAGVSARTVRFYEALGLLPAPARSEGGYRLYGEEDLRRLQFVRRARELGLSLREIRDLLDQGCRCDDARLLLERRLQQVEEDLRALEALRGRLRRLLDEWDRVQPGQDCPCYCPRIERSA